MQAVKSKKQITCEMAGTRSARMYDSYEDVLEAVGRAYPHAHKEGAAGGWSWTNAAGEVVAASCTVMRPPYGRHWLAIRGRRPGLPKS